MQTKLFQVFKGRAFGKSCTKKKECHSVAGEEVQEEQNRKEEAWEMEREAATEREFATERESGGCVKVRQSAEQKIGKLYLDRRQETEPLEVKQLGREL